jgi:hypothetical protein
MIRFYIKNNQIVFSLNKLEHPSEEQLQIVASYSGEYDKFIDKDTDHIRWVYVNGKLEEDTNYNPQVV